MAPLLTLRAEEPKTGGIQKWMIGGKVKGSDLRRLSPAHDADYREHAHALLDAGDQEGHLLEVFELEPPCWEVAGAGQQAEGCKLSFYLVLYTWKKGGN